MKLSVTIISEDYPPNYGGISQWARGVAENLHDLGCNVNVICRHISHVENHHQWPFPVNFVQRKHWKRLRSFYWRSAFKEQLQNGQIPDVVIGTKWSTTRGLLGLCRKFSIPLVTVVHGTDVTRSMSGFKKRLLAATLKRSGLIISVSQFTADFLLENFAVQQDKLVVLPNGVDLEQFDKFEHVEELRQSLGLSDKRVVLTLSRVIERKGHDLMIRALPKVLQRHKDVRYVISGPGSKAEIERLRNLARELGVENEVLITGYVEADQLNSMYALCDVYTMPSRFDTSIGDSEGFGITFLEANACKKPVIGGLSGGCGDAVIDGETGFLVDPTNPDELADKVLYLLDNPESAQKLGEQGYQRIASELNWRAISEKMLGILKERLLK